MTKRAQKLWNTYIEGYSEALMTPVENFSTYLDKDSRKILASVIREIVSEFEYFRDDDSFGSMVVSSRDLIDLADDLEAL